MQLNISTDYAIHIIMYMACKKGIVPSKELSDKLGIPQSYVFKVGKKLQKAGLIYSSAGTQGGFSLSKPAQQISMFDIIDTMENTTKINRCLEEDGEFDKIIYEDCSVKNVYFKIQKYFEEELQKMTINKLVDESR